MFKTFAVFPPGLEEVMGRELEAMGLPSGTEQSGGIEVQANFEELMRANLWSRVATRFLIRISEFPANHLSQLEKASRKIDWKAFIPPNSTLRIKVTCRKSRIYHSGAAAERIVKGIERAVPTACLANPAEQATQSVLLRIENNFCTLSLDAAGAPLYQRGYKESSVAAPLRENLAAAFLHLCNWSANAPLVDPMAGSGTIPIEAALLAGNRAPGLHEDFAFLKWPCTPQATWEKLIEEAKDVAIPIEAPIFASDRDEKAIQAISINAQNAGVRDAIEIVQRPFTQTAQCLPQAPGLILFNPPYGQRIGKRSPLRSLFTSLRNTISTAFEPWDVGMISPKSTLSDIVEPILKPCSPPIFHGGIRIYLFGKSSSGINKSEVVE